MYAFDAYSCIVLSVQRTLHILILHLRPIIPLPLRPILVLCCLCTEVPILILHSRPTLPLPLQPILVLCCLCRGGGGTWGLYWYRCVYGYGILTVHRLVLLLVPVLEAVPGVLVVAGLQFVLFTRGHSVYRLRHRNFRGLNLSRYNKTVVDLFYSTYKTDKQFRYTLKHITTMAWLESLLPSDACFESFTFWNLPSTNAKWLPELAVHDVICLHLPPALPILYKFL